VFYPNEEEVYGPLMEKFMLKFNVKKVWVECYNELATTEWMEVALDKTEELIMELNLFKNEEDRMFGNGLEELLSIIHRK
jgi:hypothetical protein